MKKIISLISAFVFCFSLSITAMASSNEPIMNNSDLCEMGNVTIQSEAERLRTAKKEVAAEELIALISGAKKASTEDIDAACKAYIDQFEPLSTYKYNENLASVERATSAVYDLGYTCVEQETSYYCGPASAYILLDGMGISSNDGTSLSQDAMATALGTGSDGTGFPGSWTSTLNDWTNSSRFVATWGSSHSDWESSRYYNYAYTAIVVGQHGFINDVHMTSSSSTLVGYSSSSTYWHYLTADGMNTSSELIHYLDSSNSSSYPSRYGEHWEEASVMAELTVDRGIIW